MTTIKNITDNLNQRKVKVFLLFLTCSFLAWLISNLSEHYESKASFYVQYENIPDSIVLSKAVKRSVEVKLRASGFQFLYYNFNLKKISFDLTKMHKKGARYYIPIGMLGNALNAQLSNSVSLLEMERDTFFVDAYEVVSKEVPIKANLTLKLGQNHILDGELDIVPEKVKIKGPAKEIYPIDEIETVAVTMNELFTDFSVDTQLQIPENHLNTEVSIHSVKISGKVVRFSEKVFEVSILVANVPEGYRVKVFPNSVSVLCKAKMDRLGDIRTNEFGVIADYGQQKIKNTMRLKIDRRPEDVYDVRLMENQVDFILEQY
ncbi:MAG: YbbR-like domain-containing protein [Bacteroidota bacterium]